MPPAPRQSPPEPSALEGRVTQIEDRLDQIAGTLERIANLELPSPQAIDDLSVRLGALEGRPDTVDYGQTSKGSAVQKTPPPPQLCPECGAVEGSHFDHCERGFGASALPKSIAERERLAGALGVKPNQLTIGARERYDREVGRAAASNA